MSDFDDVVLQSEPETPSEPEVPEEVVEEEVQESEPEVPVWEKYGFDSQESMDKKLKGLNDWEKALQREASLLGAQKKAIPEPEPDPDGDIFDQLDTKTAEQFRKAIQREAQAIVTKTVGPQAEVAEELFNDNAAALFKSFSEDNGIDSDELYAFMGEHSLFPAKPSLSLLKNQLALAADAYKGRNVETLVEKRLAEEMAKLKKDGAEVKAVEPTGKKEPDGAEDDFSKLSFLDKLSLARQGKF